MKDGVSEVKKIACYNMIQHIRTNPNHKEIKNTLHLINVRFQKSKQQKMRKLYLQFTKTGLG